MASLTSKDNRNLAQFVQNQKKIFRRNEMLKTAPHIGSHTVLRVWRCTNEYSYRDPIALDPRSELVYERNEGVEHDEWLAAVQEVSDMAIVAEWRFNETGCNTISCNPYYPGRSVCKGFDESPSTERENPFAFTTNHNQRIDACQPICYDEDQTKDTYVGMMSLYASKNQTCYVADPELIAFYLDPYRRVVDQKKEIIERSAFKIRPEYLGPSGVPTVVATIDKDYCSQYGLDYVEEKGETNEDGGIVFGGCKIDKNEGAFTALSTWTGDTITRAYNFGRDAFLGLVEDTSKSKKTPPLPKGPTTLPYLTDENVWRSHVDKTKKPLPFPLKLADLGLDEGTSGGLMWTDEYSFMDDGRNDRYGGRLVERPRGVARPPWLNENVGPTDDRVRRETGKDASNNKQNSKTDRKIVKKKQPEKSVSTLKKYPGVRAGKVKSEERFLIGLKRSIDEYQRTVSSLSGLKDSVVGSSLEVMVDQTVAGVMVDVLGDVFRDLAKSSKEKTRILTPAIREFIGPGSVSTKSIGQAMTQTALRTGIEARVVSSSSNLLKLPFRALTRGANVLSLISLLGMALDLFSTFVYSPYSRYERYMSDKLLRALAHAELVMTQRLIGHQRLLLEPSEWMVNTRYLDRVTDTTYDMLLGTVYTRARRINSDGSVIYWYKHGGLRRDSKGQLIYFDKTPEEEVIGPQPFEQNDRGGVFENSILDSSGADIKEYVTNEDKNRYVYLSILFLMFTMIIGTPFFFWITFFAVVVVGVFKSPFSRKTQL